MSAALKLHPATTAAYRWTNPGAYVPGLGPSHGDLYPADTREPTELLVKLCQGYGRGLCLAEAEEADDLCHEDLARLTRRGYEPTAEGRDLVGHVPQRWPRYALPPRGRHAVRRIRR